MLNHDVVIVGGGAGGIAAAASLLRRQPKLDIAIVEPREVHDYQPGYTLIGAGIFDIADVRRPMSSVMPKGVTWLKTQVSAFDPDANAVTLQAGRAAGLSDPHRCDRQSSRLRRDRWPRRYTRPQWRDVQLPRRPRAIYVAARQGPAFRHGAVHAAADADQMRRRSAKGDVSVMQRMGNAGGG